MKHTYWENGSAVACRLLWCYDGDTVRIQTEHRQIRIIRLSGIDAPEKGQIGYRAARVALYEQIQAAPCLFTAVKTDRYKRVVCDIVRSEKFGESISENMVSAGFAWWYKQYAPREWKLKAAEREARRQGRGVWAVSGNIPPWAWRRGKKVNGDPAEATEGIYLYRDTEGRGLRSSPVSVLLPDSSDKIKSAIPSSRQKNYIRGKRS